MTELLEDVRRRVLGIRRADWIHEAKPTHIVKHSAGKSIAGMIERFRSTVYSRMKKAEHYANKQDLEKAWNELDASMVSIRSIIKAINTARYEGMVRESHEGNALSDDMFRLMDTVRFRFQRAEHFAAQGLKDDAWSEIEHAQAAFQAMMGESEEPSATEEDREVVVADYKHPQTGTRIVITRYMNGTMAAWRVKSSGDPMRMPDSKIRRLDLGGYDGKDLKKVKALANRAVSKMGESKSALRGSNLAENMQTGKWYIYDGKYDTFLGYVLQIMGNGSAKMLKISAYGNGKPVQDIADKTFAAQSWKPTDPKLYKKAMVKIQNHPKFQ